MIGGSFRAYFREMGTLDALQNKLTGVFQIQIKNRDVLR